MTASGWFWVVLTVVALLIGIFVRRLVVATRHDRLLCQMLEHLLAKAGQLGLPARDVANATEMLENAEYGLAFDIVVEQLAEYQIPIDATFYQQATDVAGKMKLPDSSLSLLKELVT